MGRPRRQEPRRAQLVAATQRVLARDGLVGLRVRAVAAEAGVSPASIVYYYPDTFTLALEALRLSARELATERAAVAASVPDPSARLRAILALDVGDSMPPAWRAFYEIPSRVLEYPALAEVLDELHADRVAALAAVIEDGAGSGAFRPVGAPGVLAEALGAVVQRAAVARWCRLDSTAQTWARVTEVVDALIRPAAETPSPAPEPVPGRRPEPAPVPAGSVEGVAGA